MKTAKIKFLPAILAASVLTLTSCEKDDMLANESTANPIHNSFANGSGNRYIVTLKDGANLNDSRIESILGNSRMANKKFGKLQGKAFNGLAIELSADELAELQNNENIAIIEPDQIFALGNNGKGGGKGPKNNDTTGDTGGTTGDTGGTTTGDTGGTTTTTTPPTTGTTTTTTTSTGTFTIAPLAGQTLSWGAGTVGIGDGAATGRTAWIVDSGIQLNHPDLNVDAGRSRSFLTTTTNPADENGHGTKVAGLVGAKNNGSGVVGIAAGATLVSLRVMDANGSGSISSVISALNHVAQNGQPGDVVNLSLGANPSLALDYAVKAVADLGIFVTIAAGNSNADAANYSPARVNHTNVFTVSGMREDGTFMGISNWGSPVDYCAPGTALKTTHMNSAYGTAGGTSMAAPHVAGILLVRGNVLSGGYVQGDPDGNADKIAKL